MKLRVRWKTQQVWWVLCAVLVGAGCGPSHGLTRGDGVRANDDPIVRLPGTARYVEMLSPYQFGTQGLSTIEVAQIRLGESGEPASRVVLARAYLDAALYGELSGSPQLLALLAKRLSEDVLFESKISAEPEQLWPGIRLYFKSVLKELRASGEAYTEHVAAMEEGLELVELLTKRSVDAEHYKRLTVLSEEDRPFAVEARVSRLLDLNVALSELRRAPLEKRLSLLIMALGGNVCDPEKVPAAGVEDAQWRARVAEACPVVCSEGAAQGQATEPPYRGTVMIAACGYAASGWPVAASDGLFSTEFAVVSTLFAQALSTIKALAEQQGHPMAVAARPELFAVLSRWNAEGLSVPLPLESADDFAGVQLSVAAGEPGALYEGRRRFVVIDEESTRVGLLPVVAVSEDGGLALLEADEGFGFPGYAVFGNDRASVVPDGVLDLMVEHFQEVYAEAEEVHRRLAPEPKAAKTRSDEVVVFVAADARVLKITSALGVVRRALGRAGRLKIRWVVWDPEREAVGFMKVSLKPAGSYGHRNLANVPEDVQPMDLMVILENDALRVQARGKDVAVVEYGSEPEKAWPKLRAVLADLKVENPAEGFVDVEVSGDAVRVRELAMALAQTQGLFLERIVFGAQ